MGSFSRFLGSIVVPSVTSSSPVGEAMLSRTVLRRPVYARLLATASGPLRKTPLYDTHVALGGKMVPFGGWGMPVQYPDGIVKSHEWTR